MQISHKVWTFKIQVHWNSWKNIQKSTFKISSNQEHFYLSYMYYYNISTIQICKYNIVNKFFFLNLLHESIDMTILKNEIQCIVYFNDWCMIVQYNWAWKKTLESCRSKTSIYRDKRIYNMQIVSFLLYSDESRKSLLELLL